jgi:transketolase
VANGLALHGGAIPFTATFLIFSDYMRPAIRLGALMGQQVIYIFTHDSIGLGEDGPTHQPIEQLLALRAIPNLVVFRPADATETIDAWKSALERRGGPTALVFSRQNLAILDRTSSSGAHLGGYVLWEAPDKAGKPSVILIGTGSEVHIALEAGRLLQEQGIAARVVSLPSWELFQAQTKEYRASVLPPEIRARVSIEAGTTLGWERYVGTEGVAIGISGFGASAPINVLYEQFGLTAQHVVDEATKLVQEQKP